MSKRTGPTRIPIFGSRIPVPGQPPEDVVCVPPLTADSVPTPRDVGKRVRVADKHGTLRYVGQVHFAPDTWCGVELAGAVGKNDGSVRGVRYFDCPPLCGLMAPLSKVLLVENAGASDSYENTDDCSSGPYSILFGLDKPAISDCTYDKPNAKSDETYEVDNKCQKSDGDVDVSKTICETDTTYTQIPEGIESNPRYKTRRGTFTIINDTTVNSCEDSSSLLTESDVFANPLDITVIKRAETKPQNLTFTEPKPNLINLTRTTLLHNTFNINNRTYTNDNDNKDLTYTHNADGGTFSLPKNINETFARSSMLFSDSPPATALILNKISHSTPKSEPEGSPSRKVTAYCMDEEANKRDSLELEESLGLLTPDQMVDGTYFPSVVFSRTPSSENLRSLPLDSATKLPEKSAGLASPNVIDGGSLSLGIMDEHAISNMNDTTTNLELPLDSVGKSKDLALTRLEQTPSPEELPLDPTPVVETDPKTDTTKSKTTNSYIASIASITSLDTGYQGDGEMSRPASRGADNSPMTRRPLPRPQPRRPDPMTDSDFYTESDADNHEEHPLRGDRRAQVIDGTLYGVDPQAAADIYVNNKENMDSSGVFTDIESNTRADEVSAPENEHVNETVVVSPDSSTKTISDSSQGNSAVITSRSPQNTEDLEVAPKQNPARKSPENPCKRGSPVPSTVSSPASVRSLRHVKEETPSNKKYKMPKRNVASKVKAMMEPSVQQKNETNKAVAKTKTVGRWDAVMNKISKKPNEDSKAKLKEVKSKVFSAVPVAGQKSSEVRKVGVNQKSLNSKPRRVRTRVPNTPSSNKTSGKAESVHSSLSDLSGASPAKKNTCASKKREVVKVTQVLTAAKLSPRSPQLNATPEAKKSATLPTDAKLPKRNLFTSPKEKKEAQAKECGRGAIKGGRASPNVRPQTQTRAPVKTTSVNQQPPRTAEALAVLIQHLVFNLEAFRTPSLKREVERTRLQAEESRLAYRHLEELLNEEKLKQATAIEEERKQCRADISELIEQHRSQLAQINYQHQQKQQQLIEEAENSKCQLKKDHDDQLRSLKVEFDKLQRTHEESLDILREENDAIREQIDENKMIIEELQRYKLESDKLKKDYEAKELFIKEQLRLANNEIERLRQENGEILTYGIDGSKDSSVQEVQSLRAVLELKQAEVSELRRSLAEASQRAELLPAMEEKVSTLNARCEDLQLQLERKNMHEQQILLEKKKLEESFKEECNQKQRLIHYNEELQWKLKHNKEIVSRVLEQAEEGSFNRSLLSSSFNERHCATTKANLERTLSFRERTLSNKSNCSADGFSICRKSRTSLEVESDDISPPSSPKVKGVVEKSDSVSYVLDLDESPEVVASRIVRRSFRNPTPPKSTPTVVGFTTPTKSPANKRPRIKCNPLSMSASASSVIPAKSERARSRSATVRNGDFESEAESVFLWPSAASSTPRDDKFCDVRIGDFADSKLDLDEEEDIEIDIPALPSEIGRRDGAEELRVPGRLASESMACESNSDDESTSSSSVQL